jgi:peroxiredoxin/Tfp pilus assembly protein PilF
MRSSLNSFVLAGYCLASFVLLQAALLAAENAPNPGHSSHGEAFDEGPRQAALLMTGTGGPSFPVTTKHPEAQKFIDQGVGQLHGFWYWEAERSFRQAAFHDPDCAMAYWGLAMANVNNHKRAKSFIREAVKRQQSITPRERLYIDVIAKFYEAEEKAEKKTETEKSKDGTKPATTPEKTAAICDSSDNASNEEPAPPEIPSELKQREAAIAKKETELNDREQKLQKKEQEDKKKQDDANQMKLKRERLEARQRAWDKLVVEHPTDTHAAAFLVCQMWMDRNELPVASYATVDSLLDRIFAKEPNHPAHHYRIHWWDERRPENAVTSAALNGPAAPAIAHMWHMPGHTYSKLKRFHDAVYQQEASARVDHNYMQRFHVMPYQIHNFAHNNEWCIRNMRTIGRADDALRLAKNLIEIPRHPKLNNAKDSGTAGALGRDRLFEVLTRFELWHDLLSLAQSSYLHEPKMTETDQIRRQRYLGVAHAATGYPPASLEQIAWLEQLKAEVAASKDKQANSSGADKKRSKQEIEDLTRRCDEALNHIRGAICLAESNYSGARDHLKKVGNLPKEQLAYALSLAGDHEEAVKKAREEATDSPQAVVARAVFVEVLRKKGDHDAARKEFETLCQLAATADLTIPALARLSSFAQELGYPNDWRKPLKSAPDIGFRPALDSLGPLTWSSWTAEPWNLPDHTGKKWSLPSDFGNQPVVVFFYLGHGCIHCVEQLNTFGPLAKEYAAAGIQLVAIGTDPQDTLYKSLEQAKQEGGFPFPILANPELDQFKKYGCFDDFTNAPMHGTYLIDSQRRIRWQDIGSEPFTDAAFLLQEAKRLLSLPQP